MSDAIRPSAGQTEPVKPVPARLGLWQRLRAHKPDLHELERAMHTVERGDLSYKVPSALPSGLAASFNRMCGSLSNRIAQIRNHSSILAMAGGELAHGIQDLATRTEQQAEALGSAAQAVSRLNADLQTNAELARRAQHVSTQVHGDAQAGEQLMNDAMAQVRKIEISAREMSDIIAVIDSIAFQTNILALNAAVEAARAGEQGRGFAVVASEVRMLAQRSAESAAQVKQLIAQSGEHVEHGVQAIGRVGQALGRIVHGVRELNEQVSSIAAASDSQCAALSHIAGAVTDANDLAQRNADMVQDSARAARESEVRTRQLSEAVQGIRLSQGTADEARHLVDQACALIDRVGLESAAPRFMAKDGGFLDRDMYLFIFNRQGTLSAFAPNPSLVGGHLRQIQGLQWEKLLHDGFIAVQEGGGWVEYNTVHPVTGTVLHKVSYVRGLPGDRLIGCGVYKV